MVLYTEKEEDTKMPRRGHTEEEILQALPQAEGGSRQSTARALAELVAHRPF